MTLQQRLQKASPAWFSAYSMTAAFAAYFCMYAFRKPFAALSYEGQTVWGGAMGLKTALVISQIIGYMLSKYIGVKFCSELDRTRRGRWLVSLIVLAELALLLFAMLPAPYKLGAIFLNGLPLGMVWGIVVSYLEGRRVSELLLAGLSCSFIVASGVVKDIGRSLVVDGWVAPEWMPASTGLLFLPAFVLSIWLLEQMPAPSAGDELARAKRTPMGWPERRAFLQKFLPGLAPLLVFYLLLTAFRDFRDNYGVELFRGLGLADKPALFSQTEIPVAILVVLSMAALALIRNNRQALIGVFGVMITGSALLVAATLLLDAGLIGGIGWMFLLGLGSYLAYVPFGSVLFDRVMAHTRATGNAVFAIYIADSLGYSGSVALQLAKDLGAAESGHLEFFRSYCYVTGGLGVVLLSLGGIYFIRSPAGARGEA